jgi:alkylation response protein AidB-like acyl-CoA dehydrogenase
MDFALNADQEALQAAVKGAMARAAPLEQVRLVAKGDAAARTVAASAFAELGVPGLLIPEAEGGSGLGMLDAAIVHEVLGALVAPVPALGAAMASAGLAALGTDAPAAVWRGRLAGGEVRFGIAVSERVAARDLRPGLAAGVDSLAGKLHGTALFAIDAMSATHLMVSDRDGCTHLLAADAPGLTRTPLSTIDATRDVARLDFDGVAAETLDRGSDGRLADRMVEAGRLMIAADTLGAAQAMLDRAVAYALERKQFGRVIGSFQAVKHMCAEMAAAIEPARALVWHAAHMMDEGEAEAGVHVALAKAHLADVGTFVARTATEVHGGMGFTDLVGLHYWFKRIGLNRQLLGGPEAARLHAARLQGWG